MTDSEEEAAKDEPKPEPAAHEKSTKPHKPAGNPFHRAWTWVRSKPLHLVLASVAGIIVLAAIVITATPLRYPVVGLVWKPSATVKVVDATSKQPLGKVSVELSGQNALTSTSGVATFKHVKPGHVTLRVTKDAYNTVSQATLVPFLHKFNPTIGLKSNGIKVAANVTNSLTGAPVAGVSVGVGDTSILTDAKGHAELSLPPALDQSKQQLVFKKSGYNDFAVGIQVSTTAKAVAASLLPAGKVYFLSNRTGRIDLYQSNLDGSKPEVILAGTGSETTDTGVLPSVDHPNMLALVSAREGHRDASGNPQSSLFMFNADTRQLKKVEDDVSFYDYRAWSGGLLAYVKTGIGTAAIKTYNVTNSKANTAVSINFTPVPGGGTYGGLSVDAIYDDNLIYSLGNDPIQHGTYVVNIAKNNSRQLTDAPAFQASRQKLQTLQVELSNYFNNNLPKPSSWDSIDLDSLSLSALDNGPNIQSYRSYIDSPGDKYTTFIEQRDGETDLYLTDNKGDNERKLTSLGSVNQFVQWYGDDYIVFSSTTNNENALYIVPVSGGHPVKVTDFYRGNGSGYGGGYNPYY